MCVEGRAEELEFPPCFSPALLLQCSASLAPVPEDSGRQMPQHGSLISHFLFVWARQMHFRSWMSIPRPPSISVNKSNDIFMWNQWLPKAADNGSYLLWCAWHWALWKHSPRAVPESYWPRNCSSSAVTKSESTALHSKGLWGFKIQSNWKRLALGWPGSPCVEEPLVLHGITLPASHSGHGQREARSWHRVSAL